MVRENKLVKFLMMPYFLIAIALVILGIALLVSEFRNKYQDKLIEQYGEELEEYAD